MTMQQSLAVRTARQAAVIAAIGEAPVLEFREGAMPVSCAMPGRGVILARGPLPRAWAAALDGEIIKAGTWSMLAVAEGLLGHFRLFPAGSTECALQGRITLADLGGDMECNIVQVKPGQLITVVQFVSIAGNA